MSHCWGGYVGQGQREGAASDGNIDALLTCQLSHNKVTTASHFLAASPPESKHIIYPVLLDVLPTCGDFYRSGLTPRLIPAMFFPKRICFLPARRYSSAGTLSIALCLSVTNFYSQVGVLLKRLNEESDSTYSAHYYKEIRWRIPPNIRVFPPELCSKLWT